MKTHNRTQHTTQHTAHTSTPCTTSRTQDCVISSKEKVSCTVSQSSTRKMSYASSPRLPPESIDAPPACLSLSARPAAIVATPTPDRDICWILAGRTESNVHKVKKIINVAEGPNSTIEHLVNFEVFHRLLVGRGVCLASLPLPEPEILHLPCVVESFCIYKGRCAHAHTYTHARHACAHTHTAQLAHTHTHTHYTHARHACTHTPAMPERLLDFCSQVSWRRSRHCHCPTSCCRLLCTVSPSDA